MLLVVCGLLAGGLAAVALYNRPYAPMVAGAIFNPDPKGTPSADKSIAATNAVQSPAPPRSGEPKRQAPDQLASTAEVLQKARAELDAGRIQVARAMLLAREAEGSPEVALLLGRTYDPTVLIHTPQADAPPNSAEAAKWYRAWHERSVAQGQINQPSVLDRLLRSLE